MRLISSPSWIAALVLALVAPACSGGNDDDDDDSVCTDCTTNDDDDTTNESCGAGEVRADGVCETAGSVLGWSADTANSSNPFPDDRYRDEEGRALPPIWAFTEFPDPDSVNNGDTASFGEGLIEDILTYGENWGVFSPVEIKLSAAVDPDTLPGGVIVLDLGSGMEWNWGFIPAWHPEISVLDLQPVMPLDAETRYGILFTSHVRTEDGAPLGPSEDFRAYLESAPGGDMGALLDYAVNVLDIDLDSIAGATTFTTQPTWRDLVDIRERLDSNDLPPPLPVLDDIEETAYAEGIYSPDDPFFQNALREGAGNFQLAAVGTADLYDFRKDGVYDPALVADGSDVPTNPVRFHMVVSNQPMPPEGYPIVILGHGLGDSANFAWEIARFSPNFPDIPPIAFISNDDPNHGARGTGQEIGDLLGYFNLTNFFAMRDSFRQTACEYLQMRRMIQAAAEAGIPPFDMINPDKIFYTGASLGGINGATFLAVDSQVEVGILSVPSGELPRILEGESVGGIATPFLGGMMGVFPEEDNFPFLMRLLINRGIWLMAAGDSISYAPFITREGVQLPGATRKSVLIQMGIGDTVLPNSTTWDLARVMGVDTIDGPVSCEEPGCHVSGMWEFDLADYAGLPQYAGEDLLDEEPHMVSALLREAQAQLIRYLASEGRVIPDASPVPEP